jgi:hypothetical protein
MFSSQFYPYYVIYSCFAKSFLAESSLDVGLPSEAAKFRSLEDAKKASTDPFYNSFGDCIIYKVNKESRHAFDMEEVYISSSEKVENN